MHAYPSDLGESARELRAAIAPYPVAVVDMGHTICAATRSTGQIEEGPVGFSVTTIDRGVVSWKFNELGRWPPVNIIAPADRDLIIDPASPALGASMSGKVHSSPSSLDAMRPMLRSAYAKPPNTQARLSA